MAAENELPFHCEVEETQDDSKGTVTTIKCHGRLTGGTADHLKEVTKPLIARGGRIVMDFADLAYMDSSGLGVIVGLKVSTLNRGHASLELANLTPRVRELLRMTNLIQLFTVKAYPGTGSAFSLHEAALSGSHADAGHSGSPAKDPVEKP